MARIFITGSSDGLGLLTAQKLISEGHEVVLHARNEERAKSTKQQVPRAMAVLIGNLSSISETKELAKKANEQGPFQAIIHNAGIYQVPAHAKSKDGIPLLFAVNSLAPYILTGLISRPERLIYLSSGMHRHGNADENQWKKIVEGEVFPSYSDTKLHDMILTRAIARKWPEVIANAVDPGWVPTKMGGPGAPDDLTKGYTSQVWLALENEEDALKSGRLIHHQKSVHYHSQANDLSIQKMFLEVCEKLSGIHLA